MITSTAQLIRELQEAEARKLAEQDIRHPGTIGDMYEGLTSELVGLSIPDEFDLRVVTGFAYGPDGTLSPQLDVMVVSGEGEEIPYAKAFKWPVDRVMAVLEIKKSLYGADVVDGLKKLAAVFKLHRAAVNAVGGEDTKLVMAARSFARTTGRFPESEAAVRQLPISLRLLFDVFKAEQLAPVRVIFGYEGYVDEHGLREGFLEQLQTVEEVVAHPERLPTLVVSRRNSVVKMNGQPYCAPLRDNGSWPVLVSEGDNPIRILLEQLWTKLSVHFGVPLPMDDSLEQERFNLLLGCTFGLVTATDTRTISYEAYEADRADLEATRQSPVRNWAPAPSDSTETVLISAAAARRLDLSDASLRAWALSEGLDLRAACDRLVQKRLLAWTDATKLRPINDTVVSTILPGGGLFATGGEAELFNLWLKETMGQR